VNALNKILATEQGRKAGFKKTLKRNNRPGDFALNVVLFLLVHYARAFDKKRRPHYREIADHLSDIAGNDFSYSYIMERYRKIDEAELVHRYWIHCRVLCGTEIPSKTGDRYLYQSSIPDWDSVYPAVDSEPVFMLEPGKFLTKLYWSKFLS
jgi:hypothetical protein